MTTVGVMVTNGGPHSAEKWALVTGEMIFPIDQVTHGDRLILARKTQIEIIEALEGHHRGNIEDERAKMSDDRLDADYEPDDAADQALEEIAEIVARTPWAEKSKDPAWRKAVGDILRSHFATAQNVERQWHCRSSGTPRAKAWLATHHGEGV